MFRRPALYHPYKPSAPSSPAGFRLGHYFPRRCFNLFQGPDFTDTGSPAPSPLNSPIRGARHPEDDPPPTIRLADLFAGDGFESPKRPSTPSAVRRPNVKPNAVPAKDPLPNLPRRKGKHGPKHLTFNNGAHRSGVLPPHRRAQQLKDKRDAVRKRLFDNHERRAAQARDGINRLRREADALMTPEHMDDEDRIFLEQLGNLQLDQKLKHDLERCRQRMARAAEEAEERRKEHKARDKEAAKLWREKQDEEAREEQTRKVEEFVQGKEERREGRRRRVEEEAMHADEERQRAHEAMERKIREEQERIFREELARKTNEEEECRRREEEERQLREERERQQREERERRLQEQERRLREEVERVRQAERERRQREEQERKLREEVEHLRREAHERFLREERERLVREERERQARLRAEQARRAAQDDQARQHFVLYEGKWNELRTSNSIPPIDVREMPWPVFGVISSADEITYQEVRTFLFHPQRPGVEGKTARDKVKSEVLRFHPDKFNTRVVPKIQPSQQAVAQEIAGAIARILTTIMTEEVEQQK